MVEKAQIEETGIAPALRRTVISGGSAGDHTVSGIETQDRIAAVIQFVGAGTDVTDIADLTDEFSIASDGTINNGGNTDTSGDKLLVVWYKHATQ